MPFEIPDSWEWVTLGELAQYKKGPFGSSLTKAMFVPDGTNVFKVYEQKNAIKKDAKLGDYFISAPHFERLKGFEVLPEDIIVSCAGTIGETFVIPKGIRRGIINQALMYIRLYVPSISKYYLIYFDSIIKGVSNEDGKGTAMKNIPPFDILKTYLFPLPPLNEQRRIVMEVERWFSIIEELEQDANELKDTIKQTKSKILELALQGKLVDHDPNDEPTIELLRRIDPNFTTSDNPHYENLPVGWQVVPMSMICELSDGEKQSGVKRINLDVKYLRGKGDEAILSSGKYVPVGSTMILVDGENSGEIFTTPTEGYQGSTFKILKISREIYKPFILYVIKSHQKRFRENKVGSAIPHLNKKLFKEIEVLLSPFNEQQRIVKRIEEIFTSLQEIIEEL